MFICLFSPKASAQSSQNYNLNIYDIDTLPKNITPRPTPKTDEEPTPEIDKTQVSAKNNIMSISLSTKLIDFGPISPNNPIARSTKISSTSQESDYTIQAFEDHELRSTNNILIPDTSCDDGMCSEIHESAWNSNLTYGFGFGCVDQTGNCVWENHDLFRQFPDITKNENMEAVLTGRAGESSSSELNFKLNMQGTQKPGTYSNAITFILVPNF